MAHILAVVNQKGGVGKTTTALNLGVALAQRQQRILLIDLDPQASLTACLGIDPYKSERSSYSLLLYPEMTLTRVLKPIGANLALVPGSIDLDTAAIQIVQREISLHRLRKVLRESRLSFDMILIDTPPGLNVLTVCALLAADSVLIPSQCSSLAIAGIRAVQDAMNRIRSRMGHPGLQLRGVVATFYDASGAHAPKVLAELRALLPDHVFKTVIPYDVHVADAPHTGKPVVDYAPDSPAAVAYQALADELLQGGSTASD
ncbi:MAG: ParA family protein [Anaerolineae bacterium]|nr:ParA family protein [Anaerolineae bacterium]